MERQVLSRGLRRLTTSRRLDRARGDEGFILLESVIALSMVTVLIGALASFTMSAVSATTELRARQGAVQVAASMMSTITALPATDLMTGPVTSGLQDLFTNAPNAVKPYLSAASMTPVTASSALPSAASPLVETPGNAPGGVTYSTSVYLGSCRLSSVTLTAGTTSTDCVTTGTGAAQLRVVVAVRWSNRACRSGDCTYVSSSLLNQTADPVFNVNRADVPSDPVVVDPGAQVVTLGTPSTLQLAVVDGTGLGPFTWQRASGAFPAGLNLAGNGLVSGTPTALGGPTSTTVTVTDVFGRTATGTLTWRVVAAPTISSPGTQSSPRGRALSLAVGSTCPNTPCTYAVAGAPAGLSIDPATGTISGTPTATGVSAVTVTVTDADAATASTAFTWTVLDPLAIGSPGTLAVTVGITVSTAISYTCSSGPCTIVLDNTVPGVGLSTTTPVTTSNTRVNLSVANGTGTVYLTGVVQASAVPSGTSRAWTPRVTISTTSASTAATGAWTAFSRPTLGAVGTRNATVTTTKNIGLDYTCPNAPCTLTLTGAVPGIGLSATAGRTTANSIATLTVTATTGTVYLAGLVDASAVPTGTTRDWAQTVTITDAGAAATMSSGTWTASTAPKLTNPGSQAVQPNQNVALQLSAVCPNGGCTWYAEAQASGSTAWTQVAISTTGRLTYNNAPAGSYTLRVRVTDADAVTDTVTIPLTVQTFSLAMPNLTSQRPSTGSRTATLDVSAYMTPNVDGLVYTLSNNPSWMSISADGILTGILSSATQPVGNVRITVTSGASGTSQTSDTFSWSMT